MKFNHKRLSKCFKMFLKLNYVFISIKFEFEIKLFHILASSRKNYLRNVERIACVYGGIMQAGNVGKIREERRNVENTKEASICKFPYTINQSVPNLTRKYMHAETLALLKKPL